jgi:peptide chain release factor 1
MLEKLEKIEKRYSELCERLGDPEIAQNPSKYKELAKEQSGLEKTVEK